jgi:hypothetical protein
LNRKLVHRFGWGFVLDHESSVPAACRRSSWVITWSTWPPTQLVRQRWGTASLVSTRIVCSPSMSTTSLSGVSELSSAITSDVGFSVKPFALPIVSKINTMARNARMIQMNGDRMIRLGFIAYLRILRCQHTERYRRGQPARRGRFSCRRGGPGCPRR